MPVQFVVKTDLQAYEVLDATGTRIDINSLGDQYQDPDEYLDALNSRNTTLKPVPHDPASSLPPRDVEITFLDTPGVEGANGGDAEHAKRVIDAMTQMQSFNLIVIVINCEETLSKAHQLAFNYYSNVIRRFQGHHSNIVFLYTHVRYEKCHHGNADYLSAMELRRKAFSQLFRCEGSYNHEDVSNAAAETYPMYNIDFDKRQRPITKCMRLMTLREILTRAVNSPAVVLDTSASNLQQIQSITHPDELNQGQRKILQERQHVILEQGQADWQSNSIDDNRAQAMAEALKSNSTLTTVYLQNSSIGSNGAQMLAEALKINSTLTTLNLENNSIGENGGLALAEALKINSTLTTLNLGRNLIGHNGALALAEALKINLTLTTLNLENNSIEDNGALALVEALKINLTLTTLNFGRNLIGHSGALALAEALKTNSTLATLNLEYNSIRDNGAQALAEALKTNSTL
ncbi:hypothetical protein BGZ82_001915, partial [Podila clonocystis]